MTPSPRLHHDHLPRVPPRITATWAQTPRRRPPTRAGDEDSRDADRGLLRSPRTRMTATWSQTPRGSTPTGVRDEDSKGADRGPVRPPPNLPA